MLPANAINVVLALMIVGSFLVAIIIHEFKNGEPPEAIRSHYPTLSLEQVYGAITFYLGHKDEVDNDIATRGHVEDTFSETHPAPAELRDKLEHARRQPQTPSH